MNAPVRCRIIIAQWLLFGPMSESNAKIERALAAETIAVVGCSRSPGKPAHDVPSYLNDHGYEVIPVNPHATTIFGRQAVPTLDAIDGHVDLVNVFRPSDEVGGIVDATLELGGVETIWLQLGIRDDEAIERAEAAGLTVIADRCIRTEHRRLAAAGVE